MRYFSVEIQIQNDQEHTPSVAIFDRGEDKEAARTVNHTTLASMRAAVDGGTLLSCSSMVINEKCGVEIPSEYYAKEAAPAEPVAAPAVENNNEEE